MKQFVLVVLFMFALVNNKVIEIEGKKELNEYLRQNRIVLVNFYGHNQKSSDEFKPVYEQLEGSLDGLNVSLIQVNGTAQSDTLNAYSVVYTPFISLFINETGYIYNKPRVESRTVEKLNKWVRMTLRPAHHQVDTRVQLDTIAKKYNVVLVLQTNDTNIPKGFQEYANENRGVRSLECVVWKDQTIDKNKVILLKNYDHQETVMSTKITFTNIVKFVRQHKMRIVPQLKFNNYERVMNRIQVVLILVLKNDDDEKSNQIISVLESLKHELHNKVQMTYVYENQKNMLKELRRDVDKDLEIYGMLLQKFNQDGIRHYYFLQQPVTREMVLTNLQKLNNNELQEIHISEDIPAPQDPKKMQKVVYKSWEQSVQNQQKDSVVLFSVDWCESCKRYKPIYRKLAKDVLAINENIQFVLYNPQHNHHVYELKHYPTLVLYTKEKGPVEFSLKKKLNRKNTISFLRQNVGHEWKPLPEEVPVKEDL